MAPLYSLHCFWACRWRLLGRPDDRYWPRKRYSEYHFITQPAVLQPQNARFFLISAARCVLARRPGSRCRQLPGARLKCCSFVAEYDGRGALGSGEETMPAPECRDSELLRPWLRPADGDRADSDWWKWLSTGNWLVEVPGNKMEMSLHCRRHK